ncbi:MAG: glycosyltransferase family 2 protein [Acidimicrobiia bacterium]|nr:glycosyltransferase family 2 protein [Acidimicrobiia bacterium]
MSAIETKKRVRIGRMLPTVTSSVPYRAPWRIITTRTTCNDGAVSGAHPPVVVIVPARNASRTILDTLDGIRAQDYRGPIGIVVADGASTDDTIETIVRHHPDVRVVTNPSGTTPDGLNLAIAATSEPIIVRCDAHAILPPDYVRTAVETLAATNAANVGGIQDPVGRGWWQRAVAVAQSTPLGVGDARYRLGGEAGAVDTVYLGVFRRDALEAVGGFDSRFLRNQDYELNWRLREAGHTVWFEPSLRVAYTPRSSLKTLARQYFDYGRWKRYMLSVHPSSVKARQLAAPVLVVALLASVPVAALVPKLGAIVPATYATALAGTGLVETLRRKDAAAAIAPAAIAAMHLSWGFGFLVGQRPPTAS